jgi:hypothetical protein
MIRYYYRQQKNERLRLTPTLNSPRIYAWWGWSICSHEQVKRRGCNQDPHACGFSHTVGGCCLDFGASQVILIEYLQSFV